MGIFEAVKKGFGQTARLMNVVLVFFVFNVVIGLISLSLTDPARAGNPGFIVVSVISSILFFLIFIFLQGGALGMVRDQVKTAAASIAQFTAYGKKFYLRILGLLLLYILIAVGIVLLLSLVSAGILLLGDNIATKSLVAAIITIVAVGAVTLLVYPIYAIVANDLSAFEALKKGMAFAKANFMQTLGLFVVMLLISLLISLIIGFVIGLITAPFGPTVSQIVIAVINAAVQSYIPIVMMVAFMSMYLSLSGKAPATQAPGHEGAPGA